MSYEGLAEIQDGFGPTKECEFRREMTRTRPPRSCMNITSSAASTGEADAPVETDDFITGIPADSRVCTSFSLGDSVTVETYL